jgi:DNA-3-methyladenine glycosylase
MELLELRKELLLDTVRAAQELLGCVLVRSDGVSVRRARIVETEAYLRDDPASHSFRGPTPRNRPMFGAPGRAYVYRIHRAICFNIVTAPEGVGEAVLIRAVEPLEGIEAMEEARRRRTVGRTLPAPSALSNGPGKLCQALDITLEDNGLDLIRRVATPECRLWLEPPSSRGRIAVERDVRIGISKAREEKLRFFIADNPWVSVKRAEPGSVERRMTESVERAAPKARPVRRRAAGES